MKNQLKKNVLFILIIVFLSVFTVFGQVQLWVSWEGQDWFEKTIEQWEKENNETVKLVYIPQIEDKLAITLKAGGQMPDICLIKTDNLPLICKYTQPVPAEQLINITDYQFDQKLLNAFFYKAQSHALPFYADMQLMYCSQDIFESVGLNVPENAWDMAQFLKLCKTLKEKEIQPCGWGINSAYIFTGLQEGIGSSVINEKGKIDLMTQENLTLLSNFKQWYDDGFLFDYVNRPNIVKAFSKGKLAMFPQGSYLIRKFLDSGLSFEVRPLPSPWKSVIDPKGFVCFNKDQQTVSLLKHLLGGCETFSAQYIKYPAIQPKQPAQIPYYKVMNDTIKAGMIQPLKDQYVFGYWPGISAALDLILKEDVDIKTALEKAQEFIELR